MRIVCCLSLIPFIVSGCIKAEPAVSAADEIDGVKATAGEVVIADGVDKGEAAILAENYFSMYLGSCGGVELPIEKGDYWESGVVAGIAGERLEPIIIEKKTGRISWAGGPTIDDPVEHFRAELGGGD